MQITSVDTVEHTQCSCARHTNIMWRMQGLICYNVEHYERWIYGHMMAII